MLHILVARNKNHCSSQARDALADATPSEIAQYDDLFLTVEGSGAGSVSLDAARAKLSGLIAQVGRGAGQTFCKAEQEEFADNFKPSCTIR